MNMQPRSLPALEDAPLLQSHAFAAALSHLGRPTVQVIGPGGQGAIQLVRRNFGRFRIGLISRADVSSDQIRAIAREAACHAVILNPETPGRGLGLCLQTPAHVAEWDVQGPLGRLRAGLKQKWRNRLVRAETHNLRMKETRLPTAPGHWLLRQDQLQSRQRGYTAWPEDLTLAFAKTNPSQARLFEVRRNSEPIAAMLFLCHGRVATYHVGWSNAEGRHACAHQMIMWRAVESLRQRGITRVDLGTVATDQSPGLARFKLGTGARLKQLGGSWLVLPGLWQKKTAGRDPRFHDRF